MRTVTLIPGDGIGPEIAVAVQKIFAAAEVPFFHTIWCSFCATHYIDAGPCQTLTSHLDPKYDFAVQAPIAWDPVDVSPVRNADGTMGIPQVNFRLCLSYKTLFHVCTIFGTRGRLMMGTTAPFFIR